MYGPNGEAEIFTCEEDIPEGWQDNPNNFKTSNEAVANDTQSRKGKPTASAPALVEVKKAKAKAKK